MTHSITFAESFSQQWGSYVASFSSSLERNDRAKLSRFESFDDVQGLFSRTQEFSLSTEACQELTALAHTLEKLKDFMDFVSNEAKPPTDNSTFWGFVGLLSQSEEGAAPQLPHIIGCVCQNIGILNTYRDKTAKLLPEMRDTCFQIANSLLSFVIEAIKFIRKDAHCLSNESDVWEPFQQKFNTFKSKIDDAVSRLEKISRVWGLEDLNQLQLALIASKPSPHQNPDGPASFRCYIYPHLVIISDFFDRMDDIIQIERYFSTGAQDANQPLRSLTLYGLAGVGKSYVALRYAEERIRLGEIDVLLWIAGEKEVTILQSFTDIAIRLKLPGAQPKDHAQNKTLVLDWLQKTECQWLLVFDNVESFDLLMMYWPTATRGQVIITTRNHNLAFHPTHRGHEITEWDPETGSQFLVHLLSTEIGNQLTKEQACGALELSRDVSGHALALSVMAGLIHRNSWSIKEFVQLYKKWTREFHSISGKGSIDALWDLSFRSLGKRTSAILGVLAFLSPDSIPQALFEHKDSTAFPATLRFCRNFFAFSREMDILMTLGLVKRNKEKRAYSIHRLVQTSFKHYMSAEDRQKSFNDATILVSAVFPRKDAEFAQMYHEWITCSLYLPHVLSLKDSFRKEKEASPTFSALPLYCRLNNACQRYLIETSGYNDLFDLLDVNAMAIATTPPQPLSIQIDLEGELASHKGQALARVGRVEDGVMQLRESYEIFAKDQPRNLREEAWCAENLADGIASANNFLDAISFQEKARDHWLDWAKDNGENRTEWPAILKWGMGTNLIWGGQNYRARDILTQGLGQLEAAKPYNWAMVAYTNYSLGTVHRADGDFESAERHFTEAYNKWISGDNLLSAPFCGACHLREASVITERHKVWMPVEHARSLFKLSQALAKEPAGEEESARLREESTRLLRSRLPQAKDTDLEKTYDDTVFIWWR
ncbi:NB-ARC and TPR domain protein [Ilyonectria robusta]|uniref:NB-ARC and TPR domain protein n=1 Tax=Ilyonectria robusta TaxID=1079257 RepID=UPI001E8EE2BB|nr:NB-ARC and TPR domain protein [Ilyonectria robusta]KAH8729311.1 NB-ARC and TPR domain protein [Ilyonectria robusta]